MGNSKEARVLLYTKMYTAISKATAEKMNAKGESVKAIYNGNVADLFSGICNHPRTIRAFMWAVSHKTDALPTALFRVVSHGVKGTEISRIHSGFYDDQRNHIVGTNLIPFIMDAIKLWEPVSRAKKEPAEQIVCNEKTGEFESPNQDTSPKVCYDECGRLSLKEMADDVLSHLQYEIQKELEYRAQIHEKQARLQQVLDLAEMSVDELKDLLAL